MGRWRKRRWEAREKEETSVWSFNRINVLTLKVLSLHTLLGANPIWHDRKRLTCSMFLSEPGKQLFLYKFQRKAITATFGGTLSGHFGSTHIIGQNQYEWQIGDECNVSLMRTHGLGVIANSVHLHCVIIVPGRIEAITPQDYCVNYHSK